ncbi:MAG: hypothetical protein B6245_23770, partial [Desulfobacteraceae bacterium 4572_88]
MISRKGAETLASGRIADPAISKEDYLLALASGALGIGIADTLFFKSLNLLGAGFSAIIDCQYSPFTIGLSVLWLRDHLSLLQICGAIMIVSAVLTATNMRHHMSVSPSEFVAGTDLGGCLAVASHVCQHCHGQA